MEGGFFSMPEPEWLEKERVYVKNTVKKIKKLQPYLYSLGIKSSLIFSEANVNNVYDADLPWEETEEKMGSYGPLLIFIIYSLYKGGINDERDIHIQHRIPEILAPVVKEVFEKKFGSRYKWSGKSKDTITIKWKN